MLQQYRQTGNTPGLLPITEDLATYTTSQPNSFVLSSLDQRCPNEDIEGLFPLKNTRASGALSNRRNGLHRLLLFNFRHHRKSRHHQHDDIHHMLIPIFGVLRTLCLGLNCQSLILTNTSELLEDQLAPSTPPIWPANRPYCNHFDVRRGVGRTGIMQMCVATLGIRTDCSLCWLGCSGTDSERHEGRRAYCIMLVTDFKSLRTWDQPLDRLELHYPLSGINANRNEMLDHTNASWCRKADHCTAFFLGKHKLSQ